MSWRENLIEDDEQKIAELLRRTRRVAVLGCKTEEQASQPAFYVAKYLQEAGVEVLPVPVYFPDVKSILGQPVVRRVAEVAPPIDIVDVFRRRATCPAICRIYWRRNRPACGCSSAFATTPPRKSWPRPEFWWCKTAA